MSEIWILAWQQTMAEGVTLPPSATQHISGSYDEIVKECNMKNAVWSKGQSEVLTPTTFGDKVKGEHRKAFNRRRELEGAVFYFPKLPEKRVKEKADE